MSGSIDSPNLGQVYAQLQRGDDAARLPEDEEWASLIRRVSVPGHVHEISEETYWYFLEVLPPKLFNGNQFSFAEGQEPLRLFWHSNGRHFCRQLTWDETYRLCDASGLPREYGYG